MWKSIFISNLISRLSNGVFLVQVLSSRLGRKPEDIVKLDANENPYGPPPEASHICHYTFDVESFFLLKMLK